MNKRLKRKIVKNYSKYVEKPVYEVSESTSNITRFKRKTKGTQKSKRDNWVIKTLNKNKGVVDFKVEQNVMVINRMTMLTTPGVLENYMMQTYLFLY